MSVAAAHSEAAVPIDPAQFWNALRQWLHGLAAACIAGTFLIRKGGGSTSGTQTLILFGLAALFGQVIADLLDPMLAFAQSPRPIPGEMGMGCVLRDCGAPPPSRSIGTVLAWGLGGLGALGLGGYLLSKNRKAKPVSPLKRDPRGDGAQRAPEPFGSRPDATARASDGPQQAPAPFGSQPSNGPQQAPEPLSFDAEGDLPELPVPFGSQPSINGPQQAPEPFGSQPSNGPQQAPEPLSFDAEGDLPEPPGIARLAGAGPSLGPDLSDDLPDIPSDLPFARAAATDAPDDLPPELGGGDLVGEPGHDLDLGDAPLTQDAVTAGDGSGAGDLPDVSGPPPKEGELLLDEDDKPVRIGRLGVSDLPKTAAAPPIDPEDGGYLGPEAQTDEARRTRKPIKKDLSEAGTFVGDFVEGAADDAWKLGKAGVDAAKVAGKAASDYWNDPNYRDKVWDAAWELTNQTGKRAGEIADDVGQAAKDLWNDPKLRDDFFDVTQEQVDRAGKRAGEIAGDVGQAGQDVLKDPSILLDAGISSVKDLGDVDKVGDAFRRGVPGGEDFAKLDKSRPVTDNLWDSVVGTAKLAGAAETGGDAIDLGKAGIKAAGGLAGKLDDMAGGVGVADDAAKAAGRSADEVVKPGGQRPSSAVKSGEPPTAKVEGTEPPHGPGRGGGGGDEPPMSGGGGGMPPESGPPPPGGRSQQPGVNLLDPTWEGRPDPTRLRGTAVSPSGQTGPVMNWENPDYVYRREPAALPHGEPTVVGLTRHPNIPANAQLTDIVSVAGENMTRANAHIRHNIPSGAHSAAADPSAIHRGPAPQYGPNFYAIDRSQLPSDTRVFDPLDPNNNFDLETNARRMAARDTERLIHGDVPPNAIQSLDWDRITEAGTIAGNEGPRSGQRIPGPRR